MLQSTAMLPVPENLVEWVLAASRRDDVCRAIDDLHLDLQAQIDLRRPICLASGRCCRFEEFGHRLFVTTMEFAAFVRAQPIPAAGGDDAGCPLQSGRLCTVHAIRPFGCRIFFCDASAAGWQQENYERFHERLKRLHEQLGVPYAYVEWRAALAAMKNRRPVMTTGA